MNKNTVRLLFLLLLVFGFALNGIAETEGDFGSPPTKQQRERVRERIETLRMWKLTKALDLDEKTSAQLFPLLNKYDKKRFETENLMRNDMKELREAVKEGRKDNLKGILDRLEQHHMALQAINEDERTELKKILTIEQQARFILFRQEFDREMRKMIEDVRGKRERSGKGMPEREVPPGRPQP